MPLVISLFSFNLELSLYRVFTIILFFVEIFFDNSKIKLPSVSPSKEGNE